MMVKAREIHFNAFGNPPKAREKMVKRLSGYMHMLAGSAYNVSQSVMVDAVAELRQDKRLFRHQLKRDALAALRCYDKVLARQKADLTGVFDCWLDIVDIMDDEVRGHIDKMFWTIDNILLAHNVGKHRLIARCEVANAVIGVARKCFDGLMRIAEEQVFHHKVDRSRIRWFSFEDVEYRWGLVCDAIVKDEDMSGIDLANDKTVALALDIIAQRLVNSERLEECTARAMETHPEIMEKYNNLKEEG